MKPPWVLTFLVIAVGVSSAQGKEPAAASESNAQQPTSQAEASGGLPIEGASQQSDSGEPSITIVPGESRSYLQFGFHASESMETNPSGLFGYSSQYSPVTDLLGSARLHEVGRHSETAVDYAGGGSLYDGYGPANFYAQQIQRLGATQSLHWQRLRLSFRDTLQYLSEGSYGLSSLSRTSFQTNPSDLPSDSTGANLPTPVVTPGQDSYLINVSGIDFTETLTPRSSMYAGGEYSLINYFATGESEFNSRQVQAFLGYSYQLDPKDSIGAVYSYQIFQFPNGNQGTIATNSGQFTYHRTVTGRLDLSLSTGPQFTTISNGILRGDHQVGFAASTALDYRWKNSSVDLSYNHQVAAGSGLFAGVTEDVVLASYRRDLDRYWRVGVNSGYTRGEQLGLTAAGQSPGTFALLFIGGSVRRQVSRYLSAFANYGFDGENFTQCVVAAGCESVIRRHVVTVGLDMSFRPIRVK